MEKYKIKNATLYGVIGKKNEIKIGYSCIAYGETHDKLNTKEIVHRTGEERYTKSVEELIKTATMPISEEDKKKIKDFVENHKTVIGGQND